MPREMDTSGQRIVEVWECDSILRANGIPENDAIDSIKLAEVFIIGVDVFVERLEPWTSRDSDVQCFRSEEALLVEHVKVVLVNHITQ